MLKRIFGPKIMPALSFVILLAFCLCVVFLVSSLLGEKSPEQLNFRYEIGQQVCDLGGSVWQYLGNYRIELGQVSPDLKLLSVIICNVERQVFSIHKELIPEVVVGDCFKLIEPSAVFIAELGGDIRILSPPAQEICNFVVTDPPSFSSTAAAGTFCCLRGFCDD